MNFICCCQWHRLGLTLEVQKARGNHPLVDHKNPLRNILIDPRSNADHYGNSASTAEIQYCWLRIVNTDMMISDVVLVDAVSKTTIAAEPLPMANFWTVTECMEALWNARETRGLAISCNSCTTILGDIVSLKAQSSWCCQMIRPFPSKGWSCQSGNRKYNGNRCSIIPYLFQRVIRPQNVTPSWGLATGCLNTMACCSCVHVNTLERSPSNWSAVSHHSHTHSARIHPSVSVLAIPCSKSVLEEGAFYDVSLPTGCCMDLRSKPIQAGFSFH